jgi:uncharacterized protein YggE
MPVRSIRDLNQTEKVVNQRSRWTVLFAVSTLALSAPLAAQKVNKPPTIEAQGHGEVRAAADTVSVSISVDSSASTASEAAQGNAAEVAKVADAIKAKLGDRCTIVRANYLLNPQYDSNTPAHPAAFTADEQITVTFPTGTVTPEQAAKLTDTIVSEFVKLQRPSDFVITQGSYDNEGKSRLVYEVRSTASTAAAAVRTNESRSAKVLQDVKATLGDRATVETSSQTGFGEVPVAAPAGAQSPPTPSRFAAHSELLLESKQIDLLPELLRTATSLGNASVNSTMFFLRDRVTAQNEAIASATKDAQSKALSESAALGVHLGPLLNSSVDTGPNPAGRLVGSGAGIVGLGVSAPIRPSDVNVYANVVLTYAVQ